MGDLRIRYGVALGREYNFFAGIPGQKGYLAGTDGLFGQGDTTPDVTNGCLFYTNNTGSTTITDFEMFVPSGQGNPGGRVGHFEGKEITVVFLENNTRLARSSRIQLNGTNGLIGSNGLIKFLYHNSSWLEQHRSYNSSDYLKTNSALLGTTGAITVLGNVRTVEIFTAAGSASIVRTAVGGEQGQQLTLVGVGGSNSTIIVNSAANNTFVVTTSLSSTQFRLMNSGAITFVYVGNNWLEVRPVSGNSDGSMS